MGKGIFEVRFKSTDTPRQCYLALREQILSIKFKNFPRTTRGLAKAKLSGSIQTILPEEIPTAWQELNDAYRRCASEQLKSVILDLAQEENARIAREKNLPFKQQQDFSVVDENDGPLMVFYKENLQKHDILDINVLNQLEQLIDFLGKDDDEVLKEHFVKTQSSSGSLLFGYDVGIEELSKEHKEIIRFNESDEQNVTPMQEQVATQILIGSLGFTKKEIADIEKCIVADDKPMQKAKAVRTAIDAYVAKKINAETATEATYTDLYKRCDLLVKHYLADKYQFRTFDYLNVRDEDYADKLYEKIPPLAEARFIRDRFNSLEIPTAESEPSAKDKYLHDAADCIKHLETVHAKRGFFTRFVDWFRSNGENSTINEMKRQLNRLGFYTKPEISAAVNFSDAIIPNGIGEYAKGTRQSSVFTGADFDKKLRNEIENFVPEEIKNAEKESVPAKEDLFDKFNDPDAFKDEPDFEKDPQNSASETEQDAPEVSKEDEQAAFKESIANSLHNRENRESVTEKVTANELKKEHIAEKKG